MLLVNEEVEAFDVGIVGSVVGVGAVGATGAAVEAGIAGATEVGTTGACCSSNGLPERPPLNSEIGRNHLRSRSRLPDGIPILSPHFFTFPVTIKAVCPITTRIQ